MSCDLQTMLLADDQVPVYDDDFEEIIEEWFDDLLKEETHKTVVQVPDQFQISNFLKLQQFQLSYVHILQQEQQVSEFQFSTTVCPLQNDRKNRRSIFQEARNMEK